MHSAPSGLDALAASLEDRARTILDIADELRTAAGTGGTVPKGDGAVQHVSGIDQINAMVRHSSQNAQTEILTAQAGGKRAAATLAAALDAVRDRLADGVAMRTLYQHSARFDEATKAYVRDAAALGAKIRTLDEFFDRLIIVDRAVAFIPASPDLTEALAITHPGIVHFLVAIFERHWDRAEDFDPAEMSNGAAAELVTPTIRDAVRRLLIAGHPDKVIARRLGISQRSLQEHVSRLKAAVGASSRLQLGYLLGRAKLDDGGENMSTSDLGLSEPSTSAIWDEADCRAKADLPLDGAQLLGDALGDAGMPDEGR